MDKKLKDALLDCIYPINRVIRPIYMDELNEALSEEDIAKLEQARELICSTISRHYPDWF